MLQWDDVSHIQVKTGDFHVTCCCIESNDDNPSEEISNEPPINRSLGFLYLVGMCL